LGNTVPIVGPQVAVQGCKCFVIINEFQRVGETVDIHVNVVEDVDKLVGRHPALGYVSSVDARAAVCAKYSRLAVH